MKNRPGFTFIELLTVMIIIGLLASIAVPRYQGMKRKAIAANIFSDVHTVHLAAMHYYTDQQTFPPDAPSGVVPPELEEHLPNLPFTHSDYTYDWQTWSQGSAKLVGVRVSSGDTQLISYLAKVGGSGFAPIVTASAVTFMLSSN